jgi:hypothetical protein
MYKLLLQKYDLQSSYAAIALLSLPSLERRLIKTIKTL